MAAIRYEEEARRGISLVPHADQNIIARCNQGGAPAAYTTPDHMFPIIREWEFAQGSVIIFSTLDSCLGAIQFAGDDSIRGAHFAQLGGGDPCRAVKFDKTMQNAGFDSRMPIIYIGGSLEYWIGGIGQSIWFKVPTESPDWDLGRKAWIFERRGGAYSHHSMKV